MHGTSHAHQIHHLEAEPLIGGINSPWRPRIEDVEKLLGPASCYRGLSHAEIAREIGAPRRSLMEFSQCALSLT